MRTSRLKNLEMALERSSSRTSLLSGGASCESLSKVALSPSSSGYLTSDKTMCSLQSLDAKLSHRIAQVQVHIEKGLQAIMKPLEAKIGSLEKQQPVYDWHLTDLHVTVKAFGEQLHSQARQCDLLQSAMTSMKEQQGLFDRIGSATRDEETKEDAKVQHKVEQDIVTARVVRVEASVDELRDHVESMIRLVTNMMEPLIAAAEKKVSHADLDGATNLVREDLLLDVNGRTSAVSEQATNDIRRELRSLREEIGHIKSRDDLFCAINPSDIEQQVSKVRESLQKSLSDQLRQELLPMDLVDGVSKIIHTIQDMDEQSQHDLRLARDHFRDMDRRICSLELQSKAAANGQDTSGLRETVEDAETHTNELLKVAKSLEARMKRLEHVKLLEASTEALERPDVVLTSTRNADDHIH